MAWLFNCKASMCWVLQQPRTHMPALSMGYTCNCCLLASTQNGNTDMRRRTCPVLRLSPPAHQHSCPKLLRCQPAAAVAAAHQPQCSHAHLHSDRHTSTWVGLTSTAEAYKGVPMSAQAADEHTYRRVQLARGDVCRATMMHAPAQCSSVTCWPLQC